MLDTSWARELTEDIAPLRKSAQSLLAKAHGISENGRGQARVNLALALAALRRQKLNPRDSTDE